MAGSNWHQIRFVGGGIALKPNRNKGTNDVLDTTPEHAKLDKTAEQMTIERLQKKFKTDLTED